MGTRMLLIGALGVVVLTNLAAAQPNIIFSENFDAYASGSLLSTVGPWAIDGCSDGKVSSSRANSAPNCYADYKDGTGTYRLAVRNKHDLTVAEMMGATVHPDQGDPTCIDGTDANPLVLQYYLYLGPKTSNVYYPYVNKYVELTCTQDEAPTNMLVSTCSDGKQLHHLNLLGDGQVHRAIAVGQIAWADTDPCDIPSDERAQTFRLTVFDGLQWRVITGGTDLHTCGGWNIVTMTIKSTELDVQVQSFYVDGVGCTGDPNNGGARLTYTHTWPRQYTGPFTTIRMGGLPDLDTPGTCWDQTTASDYQPYETDIDDLYLYNGEALTTQFPCEDTGACCLADHTTCQQIAPDACALLAGATFKGTGTVCGVGAGKCCATPVFDSDYDGDVDALDFAAMQRCLTIGGNAILVGCGCFDYNNDGAIDSTDVEKFIICGSGAGIPADPNCAQ